DAIGSTVHLASRMEQLAPPGTIRLTRATWQLVEGFVAGSTLGAIPVKGISEPVEVFRLSGRFFLRSAWDVRVVRGLSEFVGREEELATLRHALADATSGQGRVIAISGEPGSGKSRLAHEFARAAAARGWEVAEAGASAHDRNTTYFAVRSLLRTWIDYAAR